MSRVNPPRTIRIPVVFCLAMLAYAGFQLRASAATSVSQYGITWTFSQDRPVGQFVNGDWWVVGPVTITNISPRTGDGSADGWGHGSMINIVPVAPNVGAKQGFYDQGNVDPAYDASLNIATQLPKTIPAGSSLISTITNPHTWVPAELAEKTYFKEAAVLTVLPAAPPDGSFRPPYAGSDKTIKPNWRKSSLNYSVLGNHAIPIAGNAPNLTWLDNATKRPLIEFNYSYLNSQWKASWAESKAGGYPRRTYGREIGHISGGAGLMLQTNIGNAAKEKLLINMVQWGIDVYGLLNAGMQWWPNGGHQNGRLMPIFIAGKVLNDPQILAKASGSSPFQEMSNHAFITQYHVDLPRNPHNPPFKPYTSAMIGMAEWSSSGLTADTSSEMGKTT